MLRGSTIVGVENPPGLEVRDGPLDEVADSVDVPVELDLPVQELAAGGFPDRRDHSPADVPLFAHPVRRLEGFQYARHLQSRAVVAGSLPPGGGPSPGAAPNADEPGV